MRLILFKKYLFEKVLNGTKNRTSRTWPKAPEVGDILLSKCNFREKGVPLRIVAIEQKKCSDLSMAEIREEGFENQAEFFQTLDNLDIPRDALVWTMKFEIVK